MLRKARDFYRGLAKRHPEWREVPNDDREALDYLDMGSHELIETDPAGFDSARRIVHEAEAYNLVFTVPVAENVDRCFGAVLELRA